jgi:hypothetical protein
MSKLLIVAVLSACTLPSLSMGSRFGAASQSSPVVVPAPTVASQPAGTPPAANAPPPPAEDTSGLQSTEAADREAVQKQDEAEAKERADRQKRADVAELAELQAEQRELQKAGLDGDKLSIAMPGDYRGPGNTRMTPKQLKNARFAFVLLGSDSDGYIVRRYEFAGNDIVDQRDQGFPTMPGPSAYH